MIYVSIGFVHGLSYMVLILLQVLLFEVGLTENFTLLSLHVGWVVISSGSSLLLMILSTAVTVMITTLWDVAIVLVLSCIFLVFLILLLVLVRKLLSVWRGSD